MKFCIFSNINIFAPMAVQPADKPISDNSDFHSKNYNWQHIHLKAFLYLIFTWYKLLFYFYLLSFARIDLVLRLAVVWGTRYFFSTYLGGVQSQLSHAKNVMSTDRRAPSDITAWAMRATPTLESNPPFFKPFKFSLANFVSSSVRTR